MKQIIILVFTLLSHFAIGQTLNLDEITKVRTMDSISLRAFCSEKGFKLKEKKEDYWIYSHSYFSPTDNSIWFIRTFPKDTAGTKFVNYYFTDTKTLSELKKQMKEKGFKFKRTNSKDYGSYKSTHNIYATEEDEIDIGTEKIIKQRPKYFLLYYN